MNTNAAVVAPQNTVVKIIQNDWRRASAIRSKKCGGSLSDMARVRGQPTAVLISVDSIAKLG